MNVGSLKDVALAVAQEQHLVTVTKMIVEKSIALWGGRPARRWAIFTPSNYSPSMLSLLVLWCLRGDRRLAGGRTIWILSN
jgi:hypothetical protein